MSFPRRTPQLTALFAKSLLTWFEKEKRDLPWRKERTPYRVWLSEIMLQQTRVETVVPYYQRFLVRFPAVADLAAAPLDEVYRLWEGLGYYSRARNLHQAAQVIVNDHRGEFPTTADALRELPGIGAYTSGAIASLAFGEQASAIDGNVVRVFSRLLAQRMEATDRKTRAMLEERILALLPKNNPGAFNEALMELGARVCTPRQPRCPICPIKKFCEAAHRGVPENYPGKTRPAKVRRESVAVALIWHRGKVLLEKNSARGLLGGLWLFPTFPLPKRSPPHLGSWLKRTLQAKRSIRVRGLKTLPAFVHQFTHIHMTLYPVVCDLPDTNRITIDLHWVEPKRLQEYALPRAHRRMAKEVTALQESPLCLDRI